MNIDNLPDENAKRFVAILNKKVEIGRLMNALGHMTAGLAGTFPDKDHLCFLQYKDKDDGIHPSISHYPFIVLKAKNSNKIRDIRKEVIARNIPFSDFTETMTIGTSAQQWDTMSSTPEEDLEYFGIILFGETQEIAEFTKKFSLFS